MDLEGIRTLFIKRSGREDLVAAGPDYSTDNGADDFINEGIRELDNTIPFPINRKTLTSDLSAGAYSATFPLLRAPLEVYATDGESRWKLEQLTQKELRGMYEKPFASVDSGSPLYWAASYTPNDDTPVTSFSISVMPPLDGDYTLEVYGDFYSELLVDNTDVNWWTTNHSGLVVWAALYVLEVSMRNTEGSKDWLMAINRRIQAIDFDRAEMESAEKTEAEG